MSERYLHFLTQDKHFEELADLIGDAWRQPNILQSLTSGQDIREELKKRALPVPEVPVIGVSDVSKIDPLAENVVYAVITGPPAKYEPADLIEALKDKRHTVLGI